MRSRLAGEENHYILCGFGRVGREVALAFKHEDVHFIVVDQDTSALAEADELGFAHIQGDATEDDILLAAGIERAHGLVAATGDDSHNVFITLSARGLNPDLVIVARTANPENEEKLRRAGATRVISPHAIGGRRMAMSAVRPLAVDFVDYMFDGTGKQGLRLTEIQILDDSPLAGMALDEYEPFEGIEVLALIRQDGNIVVSPKGQTSTQPGDSLIIVGPDAKLDMLEGKE